MKYLDPPQTLVLLACILADMAAATSSTPLQQRPGHVAGGGLDAMPGRHVAMAARQPQLAAGSATNLQAFRGSLGGVQASPITDSGDPARPFGVDGDTFVSFCLLRISFFFGTCFCLSPLLLLPSLVSMTFWESRGGLLGWAMGNCDV